MPNNQNRKLSAILFADIVGYTSLMQKDEAHANILLEKFHNTINTKIENHKGQVINNYGDGCVCTFDSAVSAVQCAKDVQEFFQTKPKVPVRIGLHSGDVFFKENNVYGDAVNIASRIESLGVAGAILFSKRIKRHISNQKEFEVQSLGEFDFKNVEKTMEVFALANEDFVIPKRSEIEGKLKPRKKKWLVPILAIGLLILGAFFFSDFFNKKENSGGKISMGIIPFRNISGDNNTNHYGLGMASEIRTKLSLSKKFEHLSSMQATVPFANSTLSPKQIGKELNVDYLLMGMFQIAGENIQVNVELLDAASGKGAEEIPQYQNKFSDIFQLQSEIANQVLRQFAFFNPTSSEVTDYAPDVIAYGHYVKGNEFLSSGRSRKILENAIKQFEKAIQLDSNYLSAFRGLIDAKTLMVWYGRDRESVWLESVKKDMDYVETHFPESWEKNVARGIFEYHGLSNFINGRQFLMKALEENPEDDRANDLIGAIYKRGLKTKEALYHFAKAKNQNPTNHIVWMNVGEVMRTQGDYTQAIEAFKISEQLIDDDYKSWWLNGIARSLGDVNVIPESWKPDYGNNLVFTENYFKEDWAACFAQLDTAKVWHFSPGRKDMDGTFFKKALIYFINDNRDSSTYYAYQVLAYYEKNPNEIHLPTKAYALSLVGKKEASIALIQDARSAPNPWVPVDEADHLQLARKMKREIKNYVFQDDYENATATLLAINEKYPTFGDYMIFKSDPFYNRIKKEYPPFTLALENLNLPELIPFDEPLKD